MNFKKICIISSCLLAFGNTIKIGASTDFDYYISGSSSDIIMSQLRIQAQAKYSSFVKIAKNIISRREKYRTELDDFFAKCLADPEFSSKGSIASSLNQNNQNEINNIRKMISNFKIQLEINYSSTNGLSKLCDNIDKKVTGIQRSFESFENEISKFKFGSSYPNRIIIGS